MSGEDALSPENRALIEQDAGCSFKQYGPDDVLHLCASDLNRLLNAARLQAPCVGKEELREKVARIIDPGAWPDRPRTTRGAAGRWALYQQRSLAKADAILALISVQPVLDGEREALIAELRLEAGPDPQFTICEKVMVKAADCLERLSVAPGKPQAGGWKLDEPTLERTAFEAMQWTKDPANNLGADQPSLVFARRFAFLIQQRAPSGGKPG